MSRVSKTTTEKRVVNSTVAQVAATANRSRSTSLLTTAQHSPAIAATQARMSSAAHPSPSLDPNDAPWTPYDTDSPEPSLTFLGFVQCFVTVRRPKLSSDEPLLEAPGHSTLDVWSADIDGRIVVRSTSNGAVHAPQAAGKKYISNVLHCFVTCLCQKDHNVWAGYSDGSIRVYNVLTLKLVSDSLHMHSGLVTAIAAVQSSSKHREGLVLTSAEDFQICAHHPATFALQFQLSSPAASIRCMAVDGQFLYTGGDEGFLRCWSIETRGEVIIANVYPIFAYQEGGVKSLAVHENSIFAAGGKCASMWDIVSGELLAIFQLPTANALKVLVVGANFTLWVAGSDGVVYVFDLLNYKLLHVITAHSASVVKDVQIVRKSPVLQCWLIGPTAITDVFMPTGRIPAASERAPSDLRDALRTVECQRKTIWGLKSELRKKMATFRTYHKFFAHVEKSSLAIEEGNERRTRFCSESATRKCHDQLQWNRSTMEALSLIMLSNAFQRLASRAFSKWVSFTADKRHQRAQRSLSSALLQDAHEALESLFVRRAIKAQNVRDSRDHRRRVADDLSIRNQRFHALSFFYQWKRFAMQSRMFVKQHDACLAMQRSSQQVLQSRVLRTMMRYALDKKETKRQSQFEKTTEVLKNRIVTTFAQALEKRASDQRNHEIKRSSLACLLEHQSDRAVRLQSFHNWIFWMRSRGDSKRKARCAELTASISSLEAQLSQLEAVEDPSDETVQHVENLAAQLEREVALHEEVVRLMRESCEALKQKDCNVPKSDLQVIDQTMTSLVETGVNCRSHWELIADANRRMSTKPAVFFVKSIEGARKEFSEAFPVATVEKPNNSASLQWAVDVQMIEKSSRIVLKKAASGIRDAIVAWHHLRSKFSPGDRVKLLNEVVENAPLWKLVLSRERKLEAQLVAKDPKTLWGGAPAGGASLRSAMGAPRPHSVSASSRVSPVSSHVSPKFPKVDGRPAPAVSPAAAAKPVIPMSAGGGATVSSKSPSEQASTRRPMARKVPPPSTARTPLRTSTAATQVSSSPELQNSTTPRKPPIPKQHNASPPSVARTGVKSSLRASPSKSPGGHHLESVW